jgi:hypothetical protein
MEQLCSKVEVGPMIYSSHRVMFRWCASRQKSQVAARRQKVKCNEPFRRDAS